VLTINNLTYLLTYLLGQPPHLVYKQLYGR